MGGHSGRPWYKRACPSLSLMTAHPWSAIPRRWWAWSSAASTPGRPSAPCSAANGLPWLRERGTAASMQRALGWLGYDGAQLDEDGAWLHLDLGRIIGDAELASVAHVVRASLPAHVRFYRVFHGHDLRLSAPCCDSPAAPAGARPAPRWR